MFIAPYHRNNQLDNGIQIYGVTMLFFAVCLGGTAFFALLQQPVSIAIGRGHVGLKFWHLCEVSDLNSDFVDHGKV